MAVNNSTDTRLNSRSPYYIEADRQPPAEVTIPDPIEDNTPPTVIITASDTNPTIGDTVTLTATATDSDGTIVSYLWGGGQTTSEITITSEDAISIEYFVTVTDDDGDTGSDSIIINWQLPVVDTNPFVSVDCGDTYNEASFTGTKTYRLLIGDKIGDVTIALREPYYTAYDVAVKFDLDWNGTTASTGYVGLEGYHDSTDPEDNTATPSSKTEGTTVTVEKTAATPDYATLTATVSTVQDVIPNDTYTFELICPDVTTPELTYYTLTNDCSTGDSEVTYTDIDGNTVTVTLAQGESQLVSARTGTVIETVCDTDIDGGGESFDDKGLPEQEVDDKTELVIIFDDSGSMEGTLGRLEEMYDSLLKDKLISVYGSNAEYEKRVQVLKASEFMFYHQKSLITDLGNFSANKERFLKFASYGKINSDSTKSIYLVFQDEAEQTYHRWEYADFSYNVVNSTYISDLAEYRTFLGNTPYGQHFLKFFNVDSYKRIEKESHNTVLNNIFDGTSGFQGTKGLSDWSNVSRHNEIVKFDGTPQYYYDLILSALRGYGFNI